MPLPIHPAAARGPIPGTGGFYDPNNFTEVFLAAFRRDVQSFYPGARIERDAPLSLIGTSGQSPRVGPTFTLDFQLAECEGTEPNSVRIALFGTWYRLSGPGSLGLGPRDRDLIRAIGRVMELHHQVLFRWSRISLLQLRRGMPEDHYVAACVEPSAYAPASSAPSRIAEAILTLRTLALSTYENRRVCTGALILGSGGEDERISTASIPRTSPEALTFGVELTGLKTLHRLCDGRRTLFLVDAQGKLADLIDVSRWAIGNLDHHDDRGEADCVDTVDDEQRKSTNPTVPCARGYLYHALATHSGGHVCLVLSPNQEIKVFSGGMQAFVFAHGRWRVLDPESKYQVWEEAVANPLLARVLFQTALDLAEERQGGLLVVVDDLAQAIGRLIAPHDVLEFEIPGYDRDDSHDQESPARPFSLFGLTTRPEATRGECQAPQPGLIPLPSANEVLTKRAIHYLARGCRVTRVDSAVLESLAGLDRALVTDLDGRLLALGAILRHDAYAFTAADPTSPTAVAEGTRTTAALVASRFGPVLKISEDGIVSCFLSGTRVWDL